MSRLKVWLIGLTIILVFVFLSEFAIIFKGYVFGRFGLNRNLILTILWLLPIVSSFIAVFFPEKNGIIAGISYIPILSFLAPIVHFISGQLGATIDLGGISGLRITFKIYLVLSVITIGLGCLAGMFSKRLKRLYVTRIPV